MHHEHTKKIRIYIFSIAFIVLVGAIYYLSFSISTSSSKLAQCRELFDNKDLENKKKICCDESHYNANDELCAAKCDTIGVSPNSSFCTETALKQEQPGVTRQIAKPKILTRLPECQNIGIEPNLEKDGDKFVLKAGKPLKFNYQINSPEIKAKSYVYEFFTYEDGKNNFQAISFDPGKSYIGYYNANDLTKSIQFNEVVAFHEDLYKPNLNMNSEYPKNVLMTISIIDTNKSRRLQGWNCFVKLKIDQTPNYCKNISISDKEISKGETAKITVTPNTVNVNNYDFRIINMDNNKREVAFENPITNNAIGDNNSRILVKGNKENPVDLNLSWSQLYKKDKNTDNYLRNIRVQAFVRPLENVISDDVASCYIDFKLKESEGLNLCEKMTINIYYKNSAGLYYLANENTQSNLVLKKDSYMNIYLYSKQKTIRDFIYSFHNLDNLIPKDYGKGKGYTKEGFKNPYHINFKKGVDYEVSKRANEDNDNDESIKVYYDDIDSIDLLTGSRPKKVQIRGNFVTINGETSNLDSDCIREVSIE